MSQTVPKPLASLGASLLGRRTPLRRVPVSLVRVAAVDDRVVAADVPEVILQVTRLAQTLGVAVSAPRPRAFTLRLDAEHHAALRQLAQAQGRSAQRVLIDLLDRHFTEARVTPASLPRPTSTGTQP